MMLKSNHRRQDLVDRISSSLDPSNDVARGIEDETDKPHVPNVPGRMRAHGRDWPQKVLAFSLMLGFFAIPAAALLIILYR